MRVVVTDTAGNHGEDRKVLFDYRDTTLHPGWAKDIHSGGEESPRTFDLNGDNKLDTVQADSSGELHVFGDDGSPLPSFNSGQPVRTRLYPNVHLGADSYSAVDPPREVLRTPAIGDIDGDMEPEVVDTAGEHVYAWNADGSAVPGFPVRLDPSFSRPQDRTRQNHVKRGFSGSPMLSDLNDDGRLDCDRDGARRAHLRLGRQRQRRSPASRKLLHDPSIPGAEIITTPAVGDITGDGKPDIVSPTQEFDDNPSAPATPPEGAGGGFSNILTNLLANVLGGSGRVYALDRNGNTLPGWPTSPNGIVPDALPLVGPGRGPRHGQRRQRPRARGDRKRRERRRDGHERRRHDQVDYDSNPPGGEVVDHSKMINLFENPIAANIDGVPGPEIIKGGVTLNQVVNLGVAVGQNLPYNHVIQAWNAQTGAELPSFPQAVEDYQLLSSPAVADVSDSPGQEILVGTGLYYLRDFNVAGVEGTGFPKFTGGWLFATPAIGDVDGDGKLEITTMTREGNMFVWDTDSNACGTNDEWWTSRHDEWNTGAYGTDSRPPGTPTGLTATASGSGVELQWTAPGDDWLCGTADKYRIITSNSPIEHPTDGTVVGDFTAGAAGSTESRTVASPGRFLAVLYKDENGSWGHLASTSLSYPRPKGATPFRASLLPSFKQCTAPNRTHGLPLAYGSCNAPSQSSSTLTVGTPDANGLQAKSSASLLLQVILGDPNTPRGRGRRERHLRRDRHPVRDDERCLPERQRLGLHREAAGEGRPAHHRQVQRPLPIRGRDRRRYGARAPGDLRGHRRRDDRRRLRAQHDARRPHPRDRRGRTAGGLGARPGGGQGPRPERHRLRSRVPERLRRRGRADLHATGRLRPVDRRG